MNKTPYGNRMCICGCCEPVKKTEKINDMIFWAAFIEGHESNLVDGQKLYMPKSNVYYHSQAWILFGSNKCEICELTLKLHREIYNKRFCMHNTLDPKDYSILEKYAWQCVCIPCHSKVEKDQLFRYITYLEDEDIDLEIELGI